jgi:hypothetical protein
VPGDGEGVVGAAGDVALVQLDSALKALFADVALRREHGMLVGLDVSMCRRRKGFAHPWTDGIGHDFDVEVGHGESESTEQSV